MVDLTNGVYRRSYAGVTDDPRVNALTLEAETFWHRFIVAADDFGNLPGHPAALYTKVVGHRLDTVTVGQVGQWAAAMAEVGLIRAYKAGGQSYWHHVGWAHLQPAPRNGRRMRRYPPSPWDDEAGPSDLARRPQVTSRGARGKPGEPSASESPQHQHQPEPQTNTHPQPQRAKRRRGGGGDRSPEQRETMRALTAYGVGAAGKLADEHPDLTAADVDTAAKTLGEVKPGLLYEKVSDHATDIIAARKAGQPWPPKRKVQPRPFFSRKDT